MRELMHANHAQKGIWRLLEHGRHMNLVPGIEPASMRNRTPRMQTQGIAHHMNLAVVGHLVQLPCIAQILRLERIDIVIERPVRANRVGLRIFAQQPVSGPARQQPVAHLILQRWRVAREIGQCQRHGCIHTFFAHAGARSPALAQLLGHGS